MIATDLASALDPARHATSVGLHPDRWQAAVLRTKAPRLLLNCSRQSGKSTVAALLAMHTASYEPGALVLLLSPSLRQSQELFRKALDAHHSVNFRVPVESESALRLELKNRARIISLPGKEQTIRGFSGVKLIVVDEAARVSDELYYAVRPMLAVSGGRLVALSTPFGKRGWFHAAWTGIGPWERVKVTADECPRISAGFLCEERLALGDRWFRQEYRCSFEDPDGAVFTHDEVLSMLEPWSPPPLEAR